MLVVCVGQRRVWFYFLKWCRHCHSISVTCLGLGFFTSCTVMLSSMVTIALFRAEQSALAIPLYMKNFACYQFEIFSG